MKKLKEGEILLTNKKKTKIINKTGRKICKNTK